jgi:hypothetical protein
MAIAEVANCLRIQPQLACNRQNMPTPKQPLPPSLLVVVEIRGAHSNNQ